MLKSPTWSRLVFVCLLAACSGGKNNASSTGGTTGSGGPNSAPTAAFTVSGSAVALGTMMFDGSASSDPDGDALRYDWNFGDTTRGGVSRLPHLFATAGTFTVTLTVTDPRGAKASTSQDVVIGAGTTPGSALAVRVSVTDSNGTPVVGADIAVEGSPSAAVSDVSGEAMVSVGTGIEQTVRILKPGFARQVRVLSLPANTPSPTLKVVLVPRAASQTIADIAVGGTVTGAFGAKLDLPANSLVDKNGNVVSGDIGVSVTPVETRLAGTQFPGGFGARNGLGDAGMMLSFGVVEFSLTKDGEEVNLAPGATATTELPMHSNLHPNGTPVVEGDQIPVWSLDERTGTWVQEGTGVVIAQAGSPTGFALRATLGHFSWWNCDAFSETKMAGVSCVVVEVTATNEQIQAVEAGVCTIGANFADSSPQRQSSGFLPVYSAIAQIPFNQEVQLQFPVNLELSFNTSTQDGLWGGDSRATVGADTQSLQLVVRKFSEAEVLPPTPITLPTNTAATLTLLDREKLFVLTAPSEAKQVRIEIEQSSEDPVGTISVRRPSQAALCEGSLGEATFICTVNAEPNDVIEIGVTPTAGLPGAMSLRAFELVSNVKTLPLDEAFTTVQQAFVNYEIVLQAGDVMDITLDKVGNNGTFSFDVTEVSSTLTSISRSVTTDSLPGKMSIVAPRTGSYQIGVVYQGGSGTLHAELSASPTVDVASLPYFATDFSDTQVRFFKFTATAGQRIGFYSRSSFNGTGKLTLHSPLPSYVIQRGSSGCHDTSPSFVAPADGVYYVEVDGYGIGGPYNMTIAEMEPFELGSGFVSDEAFTAPGGKFYSVDRGTAPYAHLKTLSSFFNLCFYDSSGARVTQASDNWWPMTQPGTYTLLAEGINSLGANSWGIGIDAPMTPTVLTGNNGLYPVSANIAHVGEVYLGTLPLTAGDYIAPSLLTSGGLVFTAQITNAATPFFSGSTIVGASSESARWCTTPRVIGTSSNALLSIESAMNTPSSLIGGITGSLIARTPASGTFDGNGVANVSASLNGYCDFGMKTVEIASTGFYRVRARYSGGALSGTVARTGGIKATNLSTGGATLNGNGAWSTSGFVIDTPGPYKFYIQGSTDQNLTDAGVTADLIVITDPETIPLSGGTGTANSSIAVPAQQKFYRVSVAASNFTVGVTGSFAGNFYVYTDPGINSTWWNPINGATAFSTPRGITNSVARDYIIAIDAGAEATGTFAITVTQ